MTQLNLLGETEQLCVGWQANALDASGKGRPAIHGGTSASPEPLLYSERKLNKHMPLKGRKSP
jgi:hypothetical protein